MLQIIIIFYSSLYADEDRMFQNICDFNSAYSRPRESMYFWELSLDCK